MFIRSSVEEEKRDYRTNARMFASSLPWVVGKFVMRESLEDFELYVDTLRHSSWY